MLHYLHGNLFRLTRPGDVAIHNCNCFNTWGAGFARKAKVQWPEAFKADLATRKGDFEKMGSFTSAMTSGGFTVCNIYAQYRWSWENPRLILTRLIEALEKVSAAFPGQPIIMPMIGAGLAQGDWETIEEAIDGVLGQQHEVYIVTQQKLEGIHYTEHR